ncbi:5-oxoprolinase subunit B family protein [Paludisphaera rhizosphaerae]|uniref:5-oxoprolinase subunit B family protein n=1 Tax=Paludisphaera rhizosphaerae TaxID=2711216 RepID=UPI0013EC028A|nr:allophanate hydrolase subunit 1 [Paludisphaera rhizosphaerae]
MHAKLEPLGDRAFMARFDHEDLARRWAEEVRNRALPGVIDVVLAYRSTAVLADPAACDLDALAEALTGLDPDDAPTGEGVRHEIPVLYDGPDLADAAERLGMTPAEVVARHSERDYRVFAVGFLPGFPYAGYLPEELCGLPRLDAPRTSVPAGSVAIAGRQTGIYPFPSPGGWRLLGRTPLRIADPDAGRFPIRAGDSIRFQPIDRDEFEARTDEPL